MEVVEMIAAVAVVALFLGLSCGIKWLCHRYAKVQNDQRENNG